MKIIHAALSGVAVLAICATAGSPALAQSAAQTAQQQKMKNCNAQAGTKSLKGDDRKKFMSTCLSSSAPAATADKPLTAQQSKMKDCNTQAATKSLAGDDRKKFMSTCLKGS